MSIGHNINLRIMKDLHDVVAFELFGMKFDHCLDKEEVIHEVERRLQTLKN